MLLQPSKDRANTQYPLLGILRPWFSKAWLKIQDQNATIGLTLITLSS